MQRTRFVCLPLLLAAFALTGNAGPLLYTFGGNFVSPPPATPGTPDSLNSMDAASASSVSTVQNEVGNGSTGFNGGLVAANNLLYGIGNDSNGVATLYSMDMSGANLTAVSSDFNTSGAATGVVFMNGLTAIGTTFYAIGTGATEDLYQIGANSATDIQTLNTLGGNYAGLAWDPTLSEFYAIIAGTTDGDYLVKFSLNGPVIPVANLTNLDGASVGTHMGGLADAGGGVLFDIYTNPLGTGELERIDLNSSPSVSPLYDTGIPLPQNAGIAIIPEPATPLEFGAGLVLLCCTFRRAGIGGRRPQTASVRCKR